MFQYNFIRQATVQNITTRPYAVFVIAIVVVVVIVIVIAIVIPHFVPVGFDISARRIWT